MRREGGERRHAPAWIAADGAGSAKTAYADGSLALNPQSQGEGRNTIGIANLTRFGAEADYSITWKEYTTGTSKGGILMRGRPGKAGGNPGLMDGYFFQANTDMAKGTTKMAIRKITNREGAASPLDNGKQGEVTVKAPMPGRARLYRATCKGNLLTFEYSNDGTYFVRALARTDGKYVGSGITQLLWGIDHVSDTYYDDIRMVYLSGTKTPAPDPGVTEGKPLYTTGISETGAGGKDDMLKDVVSIRVPMAKQAAGAEEPWYCQFGDIVVE